MAEEKNNSEKEENIERTEQLRLSEIMNAAAVADNRADKSNPVKSTDNEPAESDEADKPEQPGREESNDASKSSEPEETADTTQENKSAQKDSDSCDKSGEHVEVNININAGSTEPHGKSDDDKIIDAEISHAKVEPGKSKQQAKGPAFDVSELRGLADMLRHPFAEHKITVLQSGIIAAAVLLLNWIAVGSFARALLIAFVMYFGVFVVVFGEDADSGLDVDPDKQTLKENYLPRVSAIMLVTLYGFLFAAVFGGLWRMGIRKAVSAGTALIYGGSMEKMPGDIAKYVYHAFRLLGAEIAAYAVTGGHYVMRLVEREGKADKWLLAVVVTAVLTVVFITMLGGALSGFSGIAKSIAEVFG